MSESYKIRQQTRKRIRLNEMAKTYPRKPQKITLLKLQKKPTTTTTTTSPKIFLGIEKEAKLAVALAVALASAASLKVALT